MKGRQQASETQASTRVPSAVQTSPSPTASSRGNSFEQEQLAARASVDGISAEQVCGPNLALPAAVQVTGQPGYYDERQGDFLGRYSTTGCLLQPPDYYLNYGGKYCRRFTAQLRPRLSADGQAWLDRAALNLQNGIEDERRADPLAFDRLERNNAAFRAFAYGTHADAYLHAGLGDLDPIDLAMIGLTPDVGDLLTIPGIAQAVETALRILPRWGDNLDGLSPEQAAVVDAWMRSGRATIEDITAFGYELAASGLEPTIERIDSTFGEGTAERVADEARMRAQDEVESISGPVRSLMDQAETQWPWEDG
ncbi:MAG: hypothetical protein ACK41F_14430 [Fimbriimonadaceae bacterium]